MALGLVDFSWINQGQSPTDALKDTLALGQRAESLGYSRYWLGEHHVEGHACGSPQVMAGILAAATTRIRVGVAAMLLHYWAPLKLVEDFLLLEALFGRIDLGVARARADNLKSHRALLDGRPGDDGLLSGECFGARLDELVGHLRGELDPRHPHYGAAVIPNVGAIPEVWACGAANAATNAARTGVSFCGTLFHGGAGRRTPVPMYKSEFRPSDELREPRAAIAVAGVCAETEAEARALSDRFPNRNYVQTVVGSPEQCRAIIDEFRDDHQVDEVMFLNTAPDSCSRIKSAELLADVFELLS